jgi:hypothetical protein
VTQLRKPVLDELERRNYSHATAHAYVGAIRRLAEHFHRPVSGRSKRQKGKDVKRSSRN